MHGLEGARILVAEDQWPMAYALRVLLEDFGVNVIGPAATVAEADQLAAEQRPDLAVVDINLRGEMAYTLIDQLYNDGVGVLAVTGYAELPQATEEIAVVLRKPFSERAFVAALRQAALDRVQ